MQQNFRTLFHRWQTHQDNPEEFETLMAMIKSGEYDAELQEVLTEFSESDVSDSEVRVNELQSNLKAALARKREFDSVQSRFTIGRIATIAATVLVLFLAGLWMYKGKLGFEVAQEPLVTSTTVSGKQYVRLPDGTTVTLNAESSLTYAIDFGSKTREVILVGEAFFDVTHVPNRPFIVRTQAINTTVLGTAFNVKAFKDHPIVVTVMRGKVSVGTTSKELDLLTPNQEITVDSKTLAYKTNTVVAEKSIAWKSNYLIIDNMTMADAAKVISDRYHIQVVLNDSSLYDCRISLFFVKDETLEKVLTSMSVIRGGDFILKDNTATIYGKCE